MFFFKKNMIDGAANTHVGPAPGDEHASHYENRSFYQPNATRRSVEADLALLPPGSFIVRPSSKQNCLSLSAKQLDGKIGHGLLRMHAGSQWSKDDEPRKFGTLLELLKNCDHLIGVPEQ